MARWILAATLLLSACAARQVATDRAGDLARAAQLTREGCYRCLQDALGIYERRLNGARQPPAALLQPALETSVLLALREKELGIDAGPTFARARSIADRTPASAGHLTPDVLLELAALAPAETSGMDPDVAAARNAREQRERLAALRPELAQVPSPTIAETYLALSLDCVSRETREKIAADPPAVAADATLLRYRLALCLGPTRPELTALREAHPLWIEAAFFEGRAAAASRRPDLRTAVDLLSLARPVLPESPAVVVALAHVQRGYGDLEPALARTTPPSRWCRLCAKRCSGARLPSPTSSGTRSRSTRPRA